MARPGIMLYFDILEPIKVLPDADKGRLLVAMLEYGQRGVVPDFDGMLALAWGFVKPKIDKDEAEYNLSVLRRQYATVCRERKKKGEPEITFDEWMNTSCNGVYRWLSMVTNDNQWHPTTATSTTPSTTTITTTATAAAATTNTTEPEFAAATIENEVKFLGGTLGKGVVLLSEAQIEDLLNQMGMDAFDYYVDKLSSFIIEKDAKVKNHYETIIKWWQEDRAVSKRETVPKGASGTFGQAEMEAIQRNIAEDI